jgi:hypothetical protein
MTSGQLILEDRTKTSKKKLMTLYSNCIPVAHMVLMDVCILLGYWIKVNDTYSTLFHTREDWIWHLLPDMSTHPCHIFCWDPSSHLSFQRDEVDRFKVSARFITQGLTCRRFPDTV